MGLARQASRLPLTAITLGLEAWERSAGLRQFALRRGNEALQIAAHTPLGRLLPKLELDDGADEEAARITAAVRADAEDAETDTTDDAARPTTTPKPATRTAPKASTTATEASTPAPSETRETTLTPSAVSPEVEQIVEEVVDQLAIPEPDNRNELPITDFDNITLGSLRARLRNLSLEQLVTLREWEQAHAHRLPVLTALDNRIAKLSTTEAYPNADGREPAAPSRPA
ncbi:MAG: hypothetical protein QOC82_2546 [Frankiaceae bacterium]|jgi:hypothetical protein|nr:hypothetical protein [Frankiaceae bacterium]